jgi:regulator of protease activity HflC (stomatin/prohibitin superfamily)
MHNNFYSIYSILWWSQILSKDSVTVAVDAVVYYRIANATISVTNIENAHYSTRLLAQTTLRNVLGTKDLSDILSDREHISHMMQVIEINTLGLGIASASCVRSPE